MLYALLNDPNLQKADGLEKYGSSSYTIFDINDINDSLDKVAYRAAPGFISTLKILYRFNNPRRPRNPVEVPDDAVPFYAADVETGRYGKPVILPEYNELYMDKPALNYVMAGRKPLLVRFIYNGHLIEIKQLPDETIECTSEKLVLFTIEKTEKVDEITNLKISLLTMYENTITTLQEQPGTEVSNDPKVFEVPYCDLEEFLILMVFFTDTFVFSRFVQICFASLAAFFIFTIVIVTYAIIKANMK